jgi:hypothetical protein
MFNFLPTFDFQTAERLKRKAQQAATQTGIDCRVALTILTKTSAELRAAVPEAETAEAFLSNTEGLRRAIEWLEAQLELMHSAEARILAALSDTFPEAVEEGQPAAAARDEAQAAGVISDEREIPIKRITPASSRQAWMQLYERLTPDEVDAVFTICGYEISPTGELSRRDIAVQLDEDEKAAFEAQAKSHGRSLEEEASGTLAAEMRRLGLPQFDELEPAAYG